MCALDYSNKVLVGRDKEIERIIEILLRKNKCNPILLGDAGVGKTAIVEELARRINTKEVPIKLHNKRLFSISMANLVSGTKYRGEFEDKLLKIIKEIENCKNVILFIDEIHTLVGAGGAEGAIDASNILKPALARGDINVIGATTIEEYKKYIESDKALVRRFQNVYIKEPSKDETIGILTGIKESYEKFHNVILDNNVLEYIVQLSIKYSFNMKNPDRAIDILDEVCSFSTLNLSDLEKDNIMLQKELMSILEKKEISLKNNDYKNAIALRKKERLLESKINENELTIYSLKNKKYISINDVRNYFNSKYGVKLFSSKDIKNELSTLKNELKKDILCKKSVIDDMLNDIVSIFLDDTLLDRPVSFIISGKDKNKKDKIISCLCEKVFNNNIINIDLSEFKNEYSIRSFFDGNDYKSINSLFSLLKSNPQSLIVFDEYCDCDFRILSFIKDIINKGCFTDNKGYKYNFNNCLILLLTKSSINNNLGFIENEFKDNSFLNSATKVINIDNCFENVLNDRVLL